MSDGKMNPRGDVINDDTTEGSIPIKEDGKFINSPLEINKEDNRIDSSKALRLPTGSLEIGNQLKLDDATGALIYKRRFDDETRIALTVGFDGTGTVQLPFTTDFNAKEIRDILQPDDSGEITDTEITTTIPSTANQFVSKVYYKVGTTVPADPINFRLYINSIAPENLVVDQIVQSVCPTPLLVGGEFCFDLSPLVGLLIGQTFISVFSSDSAFSLQADTTNTTPWAAVDRQSGTSYRVLDERDIDDKYLGLYTSLAALELAHTAADPGQYAYVDQGAGQDIVVYIWDDDDSKYVLQLGESTAETPISVKSKYESNPNTNEFSDAEKTKLGNQSGTNTGDQDLSGLVPEAPNDGKQYSRKSEDWSETTDTVTGWISGLGIAEDSPKGTAVHYDSGTYKIEGAGKSISPAGVYDLASHYTDMVDDQHALVSICVDNDEIIKSIRGEVKEKGEVAPTPIQPYNSVCLAIVEIKVDGSDDPKDIDNKHITDERNKTSINTDETVSVSSDDQTTGYLADKISENSNVVLSIENPGLDEKLVITAPGGSSALPSDTYTGTAHIDGYNVTPLYPSGVLWIESTADISIQSLQDGQDGQKLYVINLSLKRIKFENNNGTFESILVEGDADKTADKYGGGILIFNASKGNWYYTGLT